MEGAVCRGNDHNSGAVFAPSAPEDGAARLSEADSFAGADARWRWKAGVENTVRSKLKPDPRRRGDDERGRWWGTYGGSGVERRCVCRKRMDLRAVEGEKAVSA